MIERIALRKRLLELPQNGVSASLPSAHLLENLAEFLQTSMEWLKTGFDPLCRKNGDFIKASPVAEPKSDKTLEFNLNRITSSELKLPGFIDIDCWERASRLAVENELKIFGSRISPLHQALFFKGIYVLLLKQQTQIGKQELSFTQGQKHSAGMLEQ